MNVLMLNHLPLRLVGYPTLAVMHNLMLTDVGPAKFIVSLGSDDIAGAEFKGFKRVRRFKVAAGTTLEHFKRRDALGEGQVKRELVLVEFDDEADMEKMREAVEERSEDEVGWYKLKQVY